MDFEKKQTLHKLLRFHDDLKNEPVQKKGDAFAYFNQVKIFQWQFAYLIDIANGRIAAHKGFDTCLGYTGVPINLQFLYTLFHPDESDMMLTIITRAWQSLLNDRVEPFGLQFQIDYRIRKANGEYIWVLRHSTNLETDGEGKSTVTFSVCTDISMIKKDGLITYQWRTPGRSNLELDDLVLAGVVSFSNAEKQVLRKLALGCSTAETAKLLNISAHTVGTHRKNMLRKSDLSNTAQLILYAVRNNII